MAELTVYDTRDGITPTPQSASEGGDTFANDGRIYLEATGPTSEWKIVVHNGRDCQFGDHPPFEVVSPAGQDYVRSSCFSAFRFNDKSDRVRITYEPSAVGISINALRHHTHLKDDGGSS
jgi:hypothetical protein